MAELMPFKAKLDDCVKCGNETVPYSARYCDEFHPSFGGKTHPSEPPHLDVRCGICGYERYMQTKDAGTFMADPEVVRKVRDATAAQLESIQRNYKITVHTKPASRWQRLKASVRGVKP